MSHPEEITDIEMSKYVQRGSVWVARDALDGDDPDHPYNYLSMRYGLRPEDYGYEKPPARRCECTEDMFW